MKINLDINKLYKSIEVLIKAPEIDNDVLELMNRFKEERIQKIVGKRNNRIYLLAPKEILRFYSESQKIIAETLFDVFEVKMKLYEIEEQLKNTTFVRVSKFAIVNVEMIKNIELAFNGNLLINLENGKQESISRKYLKSVKDFIGMEGN